MPLKTFPATRTIPEQSTTFEQQSVRDPVSTFFCQKGDVFLGDRSLEQAGDEAHEFRRHEWTNSDQWTDLGAEQEGPSFQSR